MSLGVPNKTVTEGQIRIAKCQVRYLVQRCRNNRKKASTCEHLALIGPFKRLGHGFIEIFNKVEDLDAQVLLG